MQNGHIIKTRSTNLNLGSLLANIELESTEQLAVFWVIHFFRKNNITSVG